MTGANLSTIYDVAKAAGVSPSTVSHVVNKTRNVSDVTRRRVEKAIAQLGYRPNDAARMLREGRAKLIGLIFPDTSNPFFGRFAYHLEMLAFEAGARIVSCNSDYDPGRENAYLDDLMRRRVDGIIIAPVMPDRGTEERLRATGLPVVVVDRVSDGLGLPTVAIDNAVGAALAAQHLHNLGHRRIGCVTARPGQVESVDVRMQSFLDTLARLGLAVSSAAMGYGEFKAAGGLDATAQILAAEPGLTAVFCTNDAMAVGALRAAAQAGRAVPGSLSVMGFDDSLEAVLCQPHLTTISQPVEAMAQAAMRLLQAHQPAERHVRLQARLVVRESTAPPASAGPVALRRVLRSAEPPPDQRCVQIVLDGADVAGRRQACLLHRLHGVALAGVHDPVVLRADELALEFGTRRIERLEERLSRGDIDGVVISGPIPSRAQAILCAARYHVGVLSAAPFAGTEAELRRITDGRDERSGVLQAALPRGFDLAVLELANQVRSGRIGQLLSLRTVCRGGLGPSTEPGALQASLFEELDLLGLIAGQPVVEVGALAMPAASGSHVVLITLRLMSGALATLELSREAPSGWEHRVEAFGSAGQLTAESRAGHGVVFRGRDMSADVALLPCVPDQFADARVRQIQAFVDTLSARQAVGSAGGHAEIGRLSGLAAPLADVLAIHRLVYAAEQALATGRPVRLHEADTTAMRSLGTAG